MRDGVPPARLTRSRRAHLTAVALLLSVVLAAGCTRSPGSPATTAPAGTALNANPVTGAYSSETAWNNVALDAGILGASGGGFSRLYARPGHRDGVPGSGR